MPIWFTVAVVVDDFGIKYVRNEHLHHLLRIHKGCYELEVDWDGTIYCGIKLKWYYNERYVIISMPIYVAKRLV